MATEVLTGYNNMGLLNTDTRLGADVVGPGLASDLEKFYDKSESHYDRAKALELLTSLQLGDEVRNRAPERPKTAIPMLGASTNITYNQPHATNYLSVYQTTQERDYPLKHPLETVAIRPMTSQGFDNRPLGGTHYDQEFPGAQQRPITPIRSGSASGSRANKPHPLQSFLVWKFPRRGIHEQPSSQWSEELTDEKINQVHKRLCQSTYQHDYLGIPQGFDVKSAYNLPPDWKENMPFTLDTVKRYSYQPPVQQREMILPTTRYGSNKKKGLPACGTIPTASSRYQHIRSRTTYDRHFNDNAGAVTQQIRDLGHKLGAEALRKYYATAEGEEKELIGKLLHAYGSPGRGLTPTPPQRPPSRMSVAKSKSRTPASTPVSDFNVGVPAPRPPSTEKLGTYSPPIFIS